MPLVTPALVALSLTLGTTITLSSDHWLLAWAGLEINTLAIIPLMTFKPHPRAIEAALKYFLTQAAASALILFSALISACYTGQWYIHSLEDLPTNALTIALMMKLGLVPTHLWMPEVIQGIPLSTGLILSTWQKLAPMALIFQSSHLMNLNLTIFLGLASIVVAGWSGIGQTQLRKILAFSSIGHLGWTIIIVKFSPELALLNFILYVIMTTAAFLTLISMNITKMTEFSTSFHKIPHLALLTTLLLLSLAGLPPFTGFIPKLLIITALINNNAILMAAVIMVTSMLSLFFYLRLSYLLTQVMPPNILNSPSLWRTNKNYRAVYTLINFLALVTFPLIPPLMVV
uniref:NADH-ubiquinone oxidoreductase chain 2 n=2 Tax=Hylarana malayana TaxID=3366710 RepID=A0A343VVW8_9NEOB|nr:NADH dehydrogenase subunit 2 [Sylvirana malayana]AVP81550.1 NADH dehydrogenase subunit 2 [Sylvirana malayana]AVP81551.1 NADH dehydrogenase subunit 2 [Sylvirana malayana]AVP81552.1 NADH dehydrogenase subunit 2 [Sylvirana malayana]AVP81553.1 NADH dehydrogenase subunit 2 [Sylvirana malayana]